MLFNYREKLSPQSGRLTGILKIDRKCAPNTLATQAVAQSGRGLALITVISSGFGDQASHIGKDLHTKRHQKK